MNDPNAKFILKKNRIIYSTKSHADYGIANITDEIAVRLLNESYDNIVHFETFPEDWKELAEGYDPAKEAEKKKAAQEEKKQALLEELLEAELNELQEKAMEMKLPEEQWKEKNEIDLAEYLYEKITGEAVPQINTFRRNELSGADRIL